MRILALAMMVLLLTACSFASKADVDELRAEVESRPVIGDLIVSSKDADPRNLRWCVGYLAFGEREEVCAGSGAFVNECFEEAVVGQPLPTSCR